MRIVDEDVALRALVGDWREIPADLLGLTYTRHWRLLSAMAVLRRAAGRDRPWLDRVAEVAPPPLPGHDLGAGLDLGP